VISGPQGILSWLKPRNTRKFYKCQTAFTIQWILGLFIGLKLSYGARLTLGSAR
jgi:hypothetical protein